MKRLFASLTLAFGFICLAEAQEKPADPVKASLGKARSAFETEVEKANQNLIDTNEKIMVVARKKAIKPLSIDSNRTGWPSS